MPFAIKKTRFFYDTDNPSDWVRSERGTITRFASYEDADAWIEEEDQKVHHLINGEHSRPEYSVEEIIA